LTQKEPARRSIGPVLTVAVPRNAAHDLEQIREIQQFLIDRMGCQGCYSGFDVLFKLERSEMVNGKATRADALDDPGV
jgi:hypothetical protein